MQVLRLAHVVEQPVCVCAVGGGGEEREGAALWEGDAQGARGFGEELRHTGEGLCGAWKCWWCRSGAQGSMPMELATSLLCRGWGTSLAAELRKAELELL